MSLWGFVLSPFFSVFRSKKEKHLSNTMRWYIFLLKLPPEGSEFVLFLNGPRKKTTPCERQKHIFIHSLNSWSLLFTVKSVKTIETRRARCRNFYKAKKKKKKKKKVEPCSIAYHLVLPVKPTGDIEMHMRTQAVFSMVDQTINNYK